MAVLVTVVEQHSDRQLRTVVIQATSWWAEVLVYVKLQEDGLVVHLPVNVRFVSMYCNYSNTTRV